MRCLEEKHNALGMRDAAFADVRNPVSEGGWLTEPLTPICLPSDATTALHFYATEFFNQWAITIINMQLRINIFNNLLPKGFCASPQK